MIDCLLIFVAGFWLPAVAALTFAISVPNYAKAR